MLKTYSFRCPSIRTILLSMCFLSAPQVGCTDDSGIATGGTGGAIASGGGPASGGVLGTGGAFAAGGSMSSGGALASGDGSGGRLSSSGGESSGGATGTGGAENSGGTSTGGIAGGTGGKASGGMGTGGEPNTAYQPCPQSGTCKILPLGDSITFGLGFEGAYRIELFRLARAESHEITFTGSLSNGPSMVDGVAFPQNHEGISGETIEEIASRVPSPALDEMPHIILLHAGTNDMFKGPDGATERLASLLDELIEEAPDALLVVSNLIPFPLAASDTDAFNASIEPIVAARSDTGAHIIFVDQFDGFPESELPDNVHPNEAGNARMAGVWYDAISAYLP